MTTIPVRLVSQMPHEWDVVFSTGRDERHGVRASVPLKHNPVSGHDEALIGLKAPLIVRLPTADTPPDLAAAEVLFRKLSQIPPEAKSFFHMLEPETQAKWLELASLQWLLANSDA